MFISPGSIRGSPFTHAGSIASRITFGRDSDSHQAASTMSFSNDLLVAGFSAVMGKKVMTQTQFDEYKTTPEGRNAVPIPLTVDETFKASYQRSDDDQPMRTCSIRYQVFVHTPSGHQIPVIIYHCSTIADLKRVIARKTAIPTSHMRLNFSGRELNDDDKTLADYSIENNSNIHVLLRIRGGGPGEVYIFDESDLAPEFNFDFSTLSDDGTVYYRGPHQYRRPYGWKRYALKVSGKYENDNWLGEPGMRTNTTPGEWSVSYHGTSQGGAQGISKEGYKTSMCVRSAFGDGIYSSPSIAVAEPYAKDFPHNGASYKIVFQNRCNPNRIKVVPPSQTGASDDYWITEREEHTRPYGICFKQDGPTSYNPPNMASNSDSWCTIQ